MKEHPEHSNNLDLHTLHSDGTPSLPMSPRPFRCTALGEILGRRRDCSRLADSEEGHHASVNVGLQVACRARDRRTVVGAVRNSKGNLVTVVVRALHL